jgi:hypothetical protein
LATTTHGWGIIPFQFYDMQTRIMILVAIIGLAVIWFGAQQTDRFISLIGIFVFLVGLLGSYMSFRNKKGMGFLRRL